MPLDYGLSASIQPVDPVMYDDGFVGYSASAEFQFDAYGMN